MAPLLMWMQSCFFLYVCTLGLHATAFVSSCILHADIAATLRFCCKHACAIYHVIITGMQVLMLVFLCHLCGRYKSSGMHVPTLITAAVRIPHLIQSDFAGLFETLNWDTEFESGDAP